MAHGCVAKTIDERHNKQNLLLFRDGYLIQLLLVKKSPMVTAFLLRDDDCRVLITLRRFDDLSGMHNCGVLLN